MRYWVSFVILFSFAACSQGGQEIFVDDYLAACESVPNDHTRCIQAAIDSASGGDLLIFSARTYYVVPGHHSSDRRYGLIYKSGLTFRGAGKGRTVFTTQNNLTRYNKNGELWFFNAPQGAHDVVFEDMSFDFNGKNNLLQGDAINNPAIAAANRSSNIKIRNVAFRDNPGNQTIFINYDNSLGMNISIFNCSFFDMGYGLSGNDRSRDHSSIYITANNSLVYGNYFANSRRGNITAIEVHGANVVVDSNTQVVGGALLILAATHSDITASVTGNIAIDSYGIVLWPSDAEFEISGVQMYGNNLSCYKRSCVYARAADRQNEAHVVGNIAIVRNVFRQADADRTDLFAVVIGDNVFGLTISNNTLVGRPGFGVALQTVVDAKEMEGRGITIELNELVDIRSGQRQVSPIHLLGGLRGSMVSGLYHIYDVVAQAVFNRESVF